MSRTQCVLRCTQRQDGGYLLLLDDGRAVSSYAPVPEGTRVEVDGLGRLVRVLEEGGA